MKRPAIAVPSLVFLASCALILSTCNQSGRGRSQLIIPQVPNDTSTSASPASPVGMLTVPAMPRPRIMIDPRDTVLQVINAQLTKGPGEEQVIAVKRMADVNSPVRLIVVDIDPERGTYYFPSWESPTDATDNRIFSLAVRDLLGDHDVEIVASGMNKDGKLTLDVFRRITAPFRGDLAYAPVCQIVADDIHILESDRPDSYADDPKNGQSFPIETYIRDPDSQNVMDLLKITYQWSPQDGRYVPGLPEKVPEKRRHKRSSASSSTTCPRILSRTSSPAHGSRRRRTLPWPGPSRG